MSHTKSQESLTIDSDGNALRESEAILANESGDLAEAAGSLVLSSRVAELNLRGLKLEVVGLRDRLDGDGAGVVLRKRCEVSKQALRIYDWNGHQNYKLDQHTEAVKRVPKAIFSNFLS